MDLALVRRGGRVEVWINGDKILYVAAAGGDARDGLGVALVLATFTDVRVRKVQDRRPVRPPRTCVKRIPPRLR